MTTRLFVDEVEGARVRVLLGERALEVPLELLPPGVREGDWVQMEVGIIPAPPSDTEERRRHLAKDDPGGPLKL